jgi:hypothetical protein
MRPPAPVLAALVVAALLAGCGNTSADRPGPTIAGSSASASASVPPTTTPAPPTGPPDPCDLLTDEEAAAAGVDVVMRDYNPSPPAPVVPTERYCLLFGTVDAYITVHVSEGGRSDYEIFRDQHDIEYTYKEISGLGDAAHAISTEAVVLTGIYVTRYNLQIYDLDDGIQQERVIALARAGTARI